MGNEWKRRFAELGSGHDNVIWAICGTSLLTVTNYIGVSCKPNCILHNITGKQWSSTGFRILKAHIELVGLGGGSSLYIYIVSIYQSEIIEALVIFQHKQSSACSLCWLSEPELRIPYTIINETNFHNYKRPQKMRMIEGWSKWVYHCSLGVCFDLVASLAPGRVTPSTCCSSPDRVQHSPTIERKKPEARKPGSWLHPEAAAAQ